jgi:sugar phosphate isomerase/epimerase/cytochrome c553
MLVLVLGLAAGGLGQRTRVQVGYCTSYSNAAAAKAAGFDYIEVATSEIAAMTDAKFESALAEVKAVGLPVPAANLFLPATLKVTGPDVNIAQQMAYVRTALNRLSQLGVEVLVFGSGGARRVPDGFSKDEAFKQLVDFGKRIAPEARAKGITVTIEPLRQQESNIINTAAEGLALVEAIGDPNFQLMIDFYHLSSEHEPPAIVTKAGAHLRHLHMANPSGRVFPLVWTEYDYDLFFSTLRDAGYNRRISVEATPANLATDAPKAIALLRRAFEGPYTMARAIGGAVAPALLAQAPQTGSVGPRPQVGPANRPVVEPAAVARGQRVWATECITCHGASARGTDKAPTLIRSTLVLTDRQGSLLGPFLAKGHPTQSGRPSASLSTAEVADLMQFLRQKINDTLRGSPVFTVQDILVGNATAGAAYFNGAGKCTACHSVTGDLAGLATRIPAPVDVQQRMLFPGRLIAAPSSRAQVTVTVRPVTGSPLSGTFVAEDDFYVTLRDADGFLRVIKRTAGMTVTKTDPLQAHHEWLDGVTDTNIHDLVAYLVTLK